ncbi:MAG: hypothetical protein K2N91_08475 [Muribaculaceae bacterium]|nr:hypothetical protein [Muribaculaceae bacterium]
MTTRSAWNKRIWSAWLQPCEWDAAHGLAQISDELNMERMALAVWMGDEVEGNAASLSRG